MRNDIFTPEFLAQIGFEEYEEKNHPQPQYGIAKHLRTNGLTTLEWNNSGHHCTYFGEPLEPNAHLTIMKDWQTRTVFSGYVFSQEDVLKILSLTF